MRYFLAIVLPPVAVLLCGKPFQFVLNCLLTLCFIFPGIIHALMVVSSHKADKRTDRLIRAIKSSGPSAVASKSRTVTRRASSQNFDFLDQ